ncbi:hypothetical protein K0B96_09130 [Horticoccus luteus]|uniref:Rod shape-determining protein MreD n=1 Tax=Horticoccus luteus TaxID=2862869 RepID=A0A8F9TTW9_9BACT|nr:hypothetical protein [Horticoccus luteus]QYM77492.1 hypothetical protein K0B96_09130 [Horticoccus luteus]
MRRRVLVLFLSQVILRVLVGQVNHSLAAWHMHVFLGALFILLPTLTLPFGEGLALALLGGLLNDAVAPVAFGTHAFLFGAVHVLLFRIRDRVPRDQTLGLIVIVLLANLALFLVFSFIEVAGLPVAGALWPRLILDLVWSQLLLVAATPWFVALQERALVLVRAQPRPAL